MGKYCHYLYFIDGKFECKILFKVKRDPGPQSHSEKEIWNIYMLFQAEDKYWLSELNIHMKEILVLNGHSIPSFVFFFPFEKNAVSPRNVVEFSSASKEWTRKGWPTDLKLAVEASTEEG